MRFDYHMHTPLCRHAVGHPRDYVAQGISVGLQEIGFSDHNPMPVSFDDWRMAPDELPAYVQLVQEAREDFPDFPIRLGLECDFIPGYETHLRHLATCADFDYLIGAVHYIRDDWDVDNPHKRNLWRELPLEEVWKRYFALYTQAASSGLFDFLAHPDLVKKFGDRPSGDLKPYYEECLNAAADCHVALELNTAGLRKDVAEIYPSREFLEMAHARNIPILINSDAHAPAEVGLNFDQALDLARSVGYTQLPVLKNEKNSIPL
ncbi:MAG: histidinol-phosphatase HisJ family protein [Blastochloris sp.]|nr:histidinol-phosphatase HisJ family protein [Blastochloris sp.]